MHSTILILDFGAQYTQLIARRVRELNVYCEIHPFDVSDAFIREFAPAGIILSGGPESVTEGDTPRAPGAVWTRRRARAGHLLRHADDGRAARRRESKTGWCANSATPKCARAAMGGCSTASRTARAPRVTGLLDVWMSHGDKVTALPPGFALMASNASTPIAGDDGRIASLLRGAIPSRGHAHPAGQARSWRASCATSAAAAATGRCRPTSTRRSRKSVPRSAARRSSLAFRAASIRRWRRR